MAQHVDAVSRTWCALALAALIGGASADVAAADPTPMPEMYAVSTAGAGDSRPTKEALDAFIRRVQELGQEGRAGRLVLRFGESGDMLGGLCVEFVDAQTAEAALQPLRAVRGLSIHKESCM